MAEKRVASKRGIAVATPLLVFPIFFFSELDGSSNLGLRVAPVRSDCAKIVIGCSIFISADRSAMDQN